MTDDLKKTLTYLASKYETKEFLQKDPSSFMHNYTNYKEQECAAFIAANLAFGRRDQILKHINIILEHAGSSPIIWIKDKCYLSLFETSSKSFYRMYSHNSMISFFDTLNKIYIDYDSLGTYIKSKWETRPKDTRIFLTHIIQNEFSLDCNLIPHTTDSASKKLNMFLRWMVRDNSPVDLGLWSDWFNKSDLLIPLDTHVMQQSTAFGLIPPSKTGKTMAASLKTAITITQELKQVFEDDPVKGDFALFGLGVDEDSKKHLL